MHSAGRRHLRQARIGPTLMRWWPTHMRVDTPEFREEGEQYWKAKMDYKRARGDNIVKKVRLLSGSVFDLLIKPLLFPGYG